MQRENQREYDKYMEEVKEAVARKTGDYVEIQKVNKVNGVQLDGLMIVQEGINVFPMIYLNDYYDKYLVNGLEAVVERMIAIYEANRHKKSIDIRFIRELEKVRPAIKMKLVNYGKNKELLEHVTYIRFLDLAIVFMVVLEENSEDGLAFTLVLNQYLTDWKIGIDELYKIAKKNTENDFLMTPLVDIVREIIGEECEEVGGYTTSVLTNCHKTYGAVGIVHEKLLKQYMKETCAEQLLILPSSMDEVLVVSCDKEIDIESFKEIVREVNKEHLLPEDFLSNSVYIYDGSTMRIAE